MLKFFKTLSVQRTGWLLLVISALALEGTALYFQYGMELQPCVMCIYERVALFGIAFAGIVGLIAPRFLVFRLLALLIAFFSTVKGLLISLKHVDYQLHPAPWNQCSYLPEFPQTLPLDKWFPALFQPTGSCSDVVWSWLGLSMAQWIVVMFAVYLIVLVLVLISQFKSLDNRGRRRLFN
ncbi:disulfide bond formation protein DsbB [Aggregatibacter actinomycetemcomitans]|uniref:disulfide bond formation protein DsbB n=1 Tax=Aggregatibacter actinomycetemcomitans TaxID=714 RepID=UPI00022ACA60|nr:disulfide bond formation protein DsbB [Aggregatibacter actinomycetemcomitans]KOE57373.1 disulfide bond formation protein DsbB [Aggregatibacter actinomycetemcomitans serotype c str. SCC2302]KOE59789.1 disulfide bond formation protein DsbB [Aggregatibacter actinomycetemcomitans serotype c str. AAS4A]TYA31712.1 disulfide bond formation protein DsbB [Aggregatibacter actinomycetemcomitans]